MALPILHIKTDFAPPAKGPQQVISGCNHEEDSTNRAGKVCKQTGFPVTSPAPTFYSQPTPVEGHVTRLPTPISGTTPPWTDSTCSSRSRIAGRLMAWPNVPTQATHSTQTSSSLQAIAQQYDQTVDISGDLDYLSDMDGSVDKSSPLSAGASKPQAASEQRYDAAVGRKSEFPPTPARSIKENEPDDAKGSCETEHVFTVDSSSSGQIFKYREIAELGTGAFSRVVLSSQCDQESFAPSSLHIETRPLTPPPSQGKGDSHLVALKIVNIVDDDANTERIRESLEREVMLLESLRHPSIVQMREFGFSDIEKKAFIALEYSPGSDLQEFACSSKHLLTPSLVRRVFAELVNAVVYLHHNWVVHRDIKLENILLNLTSRELEQMSTEDLTGYERPIITLTDFGLSRRLPSPPSSHRLRTRCGSVEYAAPEIIMGQPYDGRATDAWSIGVVLYALIEHRLPFDALPHDPAWAHSRDRMPHRIALCQYEWVTYGKEKTGQWDGEKGAVFTDAATIVEGLLKRDARRTNLEAVLAMDWVQGSLPNSLKV